MPILVWRFERTHAPLPTGSTQRTTCILACWTLPERLFRRFPRYRVPVGSRCRSPLLFPTNHLFCTRWFNNYLLPTPLPTPLPSDGQSIHLPPPTDVCSTPRWTCFVTPTLPHAHPRFTNLAVHLPTPTTTRPTPPAALTDGAWSLPLVVGLATCEMTAG